MKLKEAIKLIVILVLTLSFSFLLVSCKLNLNLGSGNKDEGNGEEEEEKKEEDDSENEGGEENEGNENPENPGSTPTAPKYHTVKVQLSDGTSMSGVFVYIYDSTGNQVAVDMLSKTKTVAEFKNLALGNYTVELKFTKDGDKYSYDESKCVLTEEDYELTVTVYSKLGAANYDIYGPGLGDAGGRAYEIGVGSYTFASKNGITYFVFIPNKSGTYGVSLSATNGAVVGLYGGPGYVLENDISESEDGKTFSVEISPLQGDLSVYTPYVIGVTADNKAECVLEIDLLGDVSDNPSFKPWLDITAKMPLSNYTVDEGKSFVELDITNPSLTVVADSQGYYHLGSVDGPLVVVKVASESKYIASFKDICDTSTFGWYHFEGETFVKKECFNSLILSYAAICDTTYGVCPLTEELAYAIQKNGEYHNWWNFESSSHIFGDDATTVVPELAWLFACGIIE